MSEAIDKPAEADPTVYRLRANAFVNPRLYRLTDDALTWEEEDKPLDGVFYDDIAEIRLAFAPTRFATNRYRAQIIFRAGGMAELFNTDYQGIGNFPEQNEAYAAFLRELHRRVAAAGKATVFRMGNSPLGYAMNILLTVFIFAMIALAFVLLTMFGLVWIAAVKLAILLYFIPTLIRYIRRAKPAAYDPLAVPAEVLPA
jgi:hypothetical protein